MLEVVNVKKVYLPKKGQPVNALDGVSIKFPEKGLVFILGKSGSGKSTLLNVLGGLDKIDSGDIIIKGKSSKDFSQGDFDSYRNTYLGFIFQEYNILNEFSVGENIELAIELQGKKATPEEINKILEEVDLKDYNKRKPNELSGGQKQRVAIARALVKNPEIILADEPTGALDSKTGIQVFETLKKLALEKLVIVVSHDREFAEYYGDRVIELKDGKVISDIEKHKEKALVTDSGLISIDNKLFALEKGHVLTEKDIKTINEALQKHGAFISTDESTNKEFKKVAKIDNNLNREAFKDTDESQIVYQDKTAFKPIKSSLPFKNAFKIGASALKTKPFRLFLTILLSFCAFAMFGIVDTMSTYSAVDTVIDGLKDNTNNSYLLSKESYIENGNSGYWSQDTFNQFTDAEVKEIENKYNVIVTPTFAKPYSNNSLNNQLINSPTNNFIMASYYSEAYVSSSTLNEMGYSLLAGKLPEKDNEVAIGDYIYWLFKEYGYNYLDYDQEENQNQSIKVEPEQVTPENIIGKYLQKDSYSSNQEDDFVITGIINTGLDMTSFDELLDTQYDQIYNDSTIKNLNYKYTNEVVNNYPSLVYVTKNYFDSLSKGNGLINNETTKEGTNIQIELHDENMNNNISTSSLINQANALKNGATITYFDSNKTSLGNNEILIDYNNLANFFYNSNIIVSSEDMPKSYSWSVNYQEDNNFDIQIDITEKNEEDIPLGEALNYIGTDINTVFEYCLENLPKDKEFETFAYEYYSQKEDLWDDNGNFIKTTYKKPNTLSKNALAYAYAALLTEPYNLYYDMFEYDLYEENAICKYSQPTIDKIGDYVKNKYNGQDDNEPFNDVNGNDVTNLIKQDLISKYVNEFTLYGVINVFNYNLNDGDYIENDSEYKIVGYYTQSADKYENYIIINDNLYNDYAKYLTDGYNFLLINTKGNEESLRLLIEENYNLTGTSHYVLTNSVSDSIEMFNSLVSNLTDILLYVGIGFAVFAALLLMNFISISITNKKQEIGILRAVGAKASDVFKIFFSEAFIIAFINFILALIATMVASYFINNELVEALGSLGTFFSFGIRQIILLLGLSILVAIVASFLPVYLIAKKKPVETIRSAI